MGSDLGAAARRPDSQPEETSVTTLPTSPDQSPPGSTAPQLLAPEAAAALLARYSIAMPAQATARDPIEAAAAARRLGLPVALKAVAPNLLHKSDAGGVRLGLADAAEVEAAAQAMAAIIPGLSGFLVQRMVPPGIELLVGVRRDPVFGPLLVVGLGGIWVELLEDVAVRLAPLGPDLPCVRAPGAAGAAGRSAPTGTPADSGTVDPGTWKEKRAEAAAMLGELRAARLLDGYRGAPPADRTALVDLIVRVGELAAAEPAIAELDLNPVIAGPWGALAVDARLLVATPAGHRVTGRDLDAVGVSPIAAEPPRPTTEPATGPRARGATTGADAGRAAEAMVRDEAAPTPPELERLLNPRSIAVVGASDDRRKQGGRLFHYLLKHRFPGRLYAVNPRGEPVMGRPCSPSVAQLPEPVDLAAVMVPAEAVAGVIADCGRRGIPAAVVYTSGFAETGEAGAARQRALIETARRHGVRLCGPNTAGVVSNVRVPPAEVGAPEAGSPTTADATPGSATAPAPPVIPLTGDPAGAPRSGPAAGPPSEQVDRVGTRLGVRGSDGLAAEPTAGQSDPGAPAPGDGWAAAASEQADRADARREGCASGGAVVRPTAERTDPGARELGDASAATAEARHDVEPGATCAAFGMAFEVERIPAGEIAFLTQSGALGSSLLSRAWAEGVGFSRWICTGNEADLSLADYLLFLADDPATRVIAIFMEAVRDPARFAEACRRARAHGKPIVAYKTGSSPDGQRAVRSHTALLAGDDRAYSAAFRRFGVVRVPGLQALVDAAVALAWQPPPRGNRVAVVSASGGACSVIADECARHGLVLPHLPAGTVARIAELIPPFGVSQNPIDVTMQITANPGMVGNVARLLLAEPEVDALIVLMTTNAGQPAVEVARGVVEAVRSGPAKPVLVVRVGAEYLAPEAVAYYRANRLPLYPMPDRAVTALRAMLDDAHLRRRRVDGGG